MGLTCECYDFDPGEHDSWWEPGGAAIPPAGERCCECGAMLPQAPCERICHMKVYEPESEAPPHPDDLPDEEAEALSTVEAALMEGARDNWLSEHGWDFDTERYERCTSADYRCERCADLAASIEALGYCLIGPGELIECHGEFIHEHGYAPRLWRAGADGVFNPHPWRRRDYVAAWLRRKRINTWYFLRYGWRHWLRWRVYERIRHPYTAYRVWKFRREYRRKEAA
jgi:hypothetical protein